MNQDNTDYRPALRAADLPQETKDEVIRELWLHEYAVGLGCTICGGKGIIDTTGTLTPNGQPVGRRNHCICPNGRFLKSHETKH